MMYKLFFVFISFVTISITAAAQANFVETQKTYPRVASALKQKEDTLQKQFAAAGLQWPPKQMYLRNFKYDGQLEVWVRNTSSEDFKLLKTYKVCALSGSLGPKRMEGDYQVPEGFYYINVFNPRSTFHLSLGLNYPNAADHFYSDSLQPGGDIYIHGSCVTVGCIPIKDNQIEELYVLASHARTQGQDFIPVHIFPIRYNNAKSFAYLQKTVKDDPAYGKFTERIKEVYDFFEKEKKLPVISVNKTGEYEIL